MLRRLLRSLPLLALVLPFIVVAHAQPLTLAPGLTLGPPRPVSDFRFGGVTGGDYILDAIPRGDGFLVFEIAGKDLRTVPVSATGHTDMGNARVVFRNAELSGSSVTIAKNGSRVVYFSAEAGQARFSPADSDGIPTTAGIPIPGASYVYSSRCNARRCLALYFGQSPSSSDRGAIVGFDGTIVATNLAVAGSVVGVDDGGFLLEWSHGEGTATSPYATHLIRLDNDGRQTFDIVWKGILYSLAALAPPGSSAYAIAWSDAGNSPDPQTIYVSSLTLDGHLGEPRKLLSSRQLSVSDIVWNGSEFLLAFSIVNFRYVIPEWIQPADVFVQRLSSAVAPLGAPVQVSTSSEGNYLLALAANGGAYYVGWDELPAGDHIGIARGAVLDAHANVVAREPFTIGPMPQVPLALAVAGDRTLTLWHEHDSERGIERLLYARSNTSDATRLDAEPFVLDEAYGVPAVTAAAAIGSDVLVVWAQNVPTPAELRLRAAIVRVADGSRQEIALPAGFQGSWEAVAPAAVASNGENWLLAVGQRYVRISRAGVVLTPQPVIFASKVPNWLSMASDGSGFLLVWNRRPSYPVCIDCGGVRYAIVDAAGTIIRPEQIPSLGGALDGKPQAAFNGRDYLVVSADHEHIWFRRFAPSGALLSTAAIPQYHQDGVTSVVTALGAGWFAAWRESEIGTMQGVRITADGTVADAPIALPFIQALASTGSSTALALTTSRIDVPPYGTGTAVALQELVSELASRRRAAGSR